MRKNLIDELFENDVFWYLLGSLISADNNDTNGDRRRNVKSLEYILSQLDDCHIDNKEEVRKSLENSISLLNNEIKQNMQYNFNVELTTQQVISWIKDWFDKNGKNCNAIIGISGGKDSTICAKLCCEALGKERVIGILLPNGNQHDFQTAINVCEYLDIKYYCVNIEDTYNSILEQVKLALEDSISEQTKINLAPRIRMTYLRAFAQSLNGRLINTSNLSEDFVGYATIDGDTCGDMSPLSNLTVTEIKQIGYYLGIPSEFVEKVPEDGLVGISDEENLGITYNDIDLYIREQKGDKITIYKIEQKYKANLFKSKYTTGLPKFVPDLNCIISL